MLEKNKLAESGSKGKKKLLLFKKDAFYPLKKLINCRNNFNSCHEHRLRILRTFDNEAYKILHDK